MMVAPQSFGAAVAADLADKKECVGLLLESAFT